MQWLYRMFKWSHAQKWITDDPSTGLRGESVLTKIERKQVAASRKDREEFTTAEIRLIFTAPVRALDRHEVTQRPSLRH